MIPLAKVKLMRRLLLVGVLVTTVGCAAVSSDSSSLPEQALSLRNLQIESVDGQRAVLLRLSRLPEKVTSSSATSPGRIVVQLSGPRGEGDFSEQALPQIDPQIAQVRVMREDGELVVTLEFKTDAPPAFSVLEMADWIMIRLGRTQSES